MTATRTDPSEVVRELMGAHPHECVVCYVGRMVQRFDCDGSWRWVQTWREQRAPRATRLERRLGVRGASCDCELQLRAYEVEPRALAIAWDGPIASVGHCLEVRAGSTQPCRLWRLAQRNWWAGECHAPQTC